MTVYARARKGNDNAAGKGADQWEYNVPLNQFNTSTMTTVSIPLSTFIRNATKSAWIRQSGRRLADQFWSL